MRIPSGKTDQNIYFVAFATADGARLTGLTGFTVYRSRNGAAEVAYTTPTISEIDATNMPGVYALLIDEDTTIASTSDSEEYCVQIAVATMEPVTRTIELYRRDTTSGQTLTVTSSVASSDMVQISGDATAANNLEAAFDGTGGVTMTLAQLAFNPTGSGDCIIMGGSGSGNGIGFTRSGAGDVFDTAVAAALQTEAADALAAYDPPTNTEMIARTLASADYATAAAVAALPTAAQNATALLDSSNGVETGLTPREAWRVIAAACAGKASGLGTTTAVYRNAEADSKDRITATVDADGNRTAVTLDVS